MSSTNSVIAIDSPEELFRSSACQILMYGM